MKRLFPLYILFALIGTLLHAQENWETPDPEDIDIDVKQFEIKPVRYDDVFPDVEGFSQGGKESWLRLTVQYTLVIRPERKAKYNAKEAWIDNVEFSWEVILAPEKRGNQYDDRRAIRLAKTVTYANVRVDKKNYFAVIYIEPRVLQRYADRIKADDIFTHLVIKVGRRTQEELAARGMKFGTSSSERRGLTAAGRKVNDIWDSEEVVRPESGLRSRRETPWAWSSYDQFETIVDQPK